MSRENPLDVAPMSTEHWKLFSIISMSLLLDGVLFSLVPTTLYLLPELSSVASLILMLNSLSFMFGSLTFGFLSDRLGRKIGLILSLSIYTVSAAGYAILAYTGSLNLIEAILLTCAINYGVGAEVGPSYAALSEFMPARHRGKLVMLALNFWNVGAAAIATASLYYAKLTTDLATVVAYTMSTAILLSILVLAVRLHIPESPRWLALKGRKEDAERIVEKFTGVKAVPQQSEEEEIGLITAIKLYAERLFVLVTLVTVQLITYNLVAYYVPYAPKFSFGESSAPLVVAVSNLGASFGAFPFLALIDRSRKVALFSSFSLGAISSLLLLIFLGYSFGPFALALFVNMVFSEWAYGSIAVLEGELFPTGMRASAAGFITAVAWLTNSIFAGIMTFLTAESMLRLNTVLWLVGAIFSAFWMIRGKETAKKVWRSLPKLKKSLSF